MTSASFLAIKVCRRPGVTAKVVLQLTVKINGLIKAPHWQKTISVTFYA